MPHTRRLHLENRPIARSIIARRDDEGEKHEARAAVPQPPRVLPAGAAPSRGAPERTKRLGLQSRVERDEKESARSTARVRRQVVPAANAHALENRCEEARRSAREFPDACAENAHCARSAASVQRRCVLQSTSPAMCVCFVLQLHVSDVLVEQALPMPSRLKSTNFEPRSSSYRCGACTQLWVAVHPFLTAVH